MKTLISQNNENGVSLLELAEPVSDTSATLSLPANPPVNAADEINRLCAEAVRLSRYSSEALHGALLAGWQAGKLLMEEKEKVRERMGPGAWLLWLEQNFKGTPRTAQRYMLLAKMVPNVSLISGMSLRQAYIRLGISTSPKGSPDPLRHPPLPRYVTLAHRLLGELTPKDRQGALTPAMRADYERDLRGLYVRLGSLLGG
jgi:hypothetical protein